jgi:type IV pilus assembly protein PilA
MKKNAFTLIELLAVIVILAIILAIAVPSISDIIENSTKESFGIDAKMVLKAINNKKLESRDFDVNNINKDNIEDLLNVSNTNYDSVNVIMRDKTTIITLVGANKWKGLVACGAYSNMKEVRIHGTGSSRHGGFPEATALTDATMSASTRRSRFG